MSFVIASPEALLAAATDLAAIRSTIRAANAAAAVPTTGALAPAADEVSAGIAALFGAQAQSYQAVSAQAAAFHDRFVQLLNAGGGSYASAEIANAQQNLLNAVNAPTQTLLGRPLVGDGVGGRRRGRRFRGVDRQWRRRGSRRTQRPRGSRRQRWLAARQRRDRRARGRVEHPRHEWWSRRNRRCRRTFGLGSERRSRRPR